MATGKTRLLLAAAVLMLHSAQTGDTNVSTLRAFTLTEFLILFQFHMEFLLFSSFSFRSSVDRLGPLTSYHLQLNVLPTTQGIRTYKNCTATISSLAIFILEKV
jgi:hypothetical protein